MAADRKSTRLNSSHVEISYAVFCLKKKKKTERHWRDEENQAERRQWQRERRRLLSQLFLFHLSYPTSHLFLFFFFNDTATTEIYTLSLHDALPIRSSSRWASRWRPGSSSTPS